MFIYDLEQMKRFLERAIWFRQWLLGQKIVKAKRVLRAVDSQQKIKCFCFEGARVEFYRWRTDRGIWLFASSKASYYGSYFDFDMYTCPFKIPPEKGSYNISMPDEVAQYFGEIEISGQLLKDKLQELGKEIPVWLFEDSDYGPIRLNDDTNLPLDAIADLVVEQIKENIINIQAGNLV